MESRSQDKSESGDDSMGTHREIELDNDERIDITDSSHDHAKSSSNSSSSNSTSSSDDETEIVKMKHEDKETSDLVMVAVEAPFTANVIVENTGLMDSATPNSGKMIEISDNVAENKPNVTISDEIRKTSSSATDSDKKKATHGIAQRTSWFSCCGLFDVVTGSSR